MTALRLPSRLPPQTYPGVSVYRSRRLLGRQRLRVPEPPGERVLRVRAIVCAVLGAIAALVFWLGR